MSARSLRKVLFLQKTDLVEAQKPLVLEHFAREFPETEVMFAGDVSAVPAEHFDAVIAPTLPWLPQALRRAAGWEWIHFLSAGVEKIWEMPVDWSGVAMTKSSGIHGPQMSEYVIGAMLHFAKGFDRFTAQSRERKWARSWLSELTGETVMILGAGHIGEWVARRCKEFDMRVVAVTRSGHTVKEADVSLVLRDAHAMLPETNYLVVCVPFTDETKNLVDSDFLDRLAAGAVLVDISRGGIVSAEAVLSALDRGILRGAALDVFTEEPLSSTSPLWERSDILLTPHVSGTSPHYLSRALAVFFMNAKAWSNGDEFVTPVNHSVGY